MSAAAAPARAAPGPEPVARLDVLTLELGGETLAIPAALLREVLEPGPITRVPRAGAFAAGLVNVRGAVVPLADLRVALGMARRPPDRDTRILVLDLPLAGGAAVIGILADRVHEVTGIDRAALQPVPALGSRWPPDFVQAIARWRGGVLLLPDLEAILAAHSASPPRPPQTE